MQSTTRIRKTRSALPSVKDEKKVVKVVRMIFEVLAAMVKEKRLHRSALIRLTRC